MNEKLVVSAVFCLLAGCQRIQFPPQNDFALPPFDLSASADMGGDDLGGDGGAVDDDLAGADLSGTKTDPSTTDAATSTVKLTINEMNQTLSGGLDLVELVAHGAGNVSGIVLSLDIKTAGVTPTVLVTMPSLTVADGDFLVVHLKAAITSETTTKGDCADASCFANAWDIAGSATKDIPDSAHVLTLANAGGTIVDGLAISKGSGQPSTWPAQLQALQTAGVWDPTTCANGCTATDADALAVDSSGTDSSIAGKSLQRDDAIIPSTKAHWTLAASTWGAAN